MLQAEFSVAEAAAVGLGLPADGMHLISHNSISGSRSDVSTHSVH